MEHSEESCTREQERRRLAAAERGLIKPQLCRTYGYTVFGRVIDGFDVVAKIENLPTEQRGDFEAIPVDTVTILKIDPRGMHLASYPFRSSLFPISS